METDFTIGCMVSMGSHGIAAPKLPFVQSDTY